MLAMQVHGKVVVEAHGVLRDPQVLHAGGQQVVLVHAQGALGRFGRGKMHGPGRGGVWEWHHRHGDGVTRKP